MKPTLSMFFVLVIAACSSGNTTPAAPVVCADRTGTYKLSFLYESGNCGDLGATIQTLERQPTADDIIAMGCSGQLVYSVDNCEVTDVDLKCPITGGTSTFNGKYYWNVDGSQGSGEVSIEIALGSTLCFGTYHATMSRL